MPSKLCPIINKWFGWQPGNWDSASFNTWMSSYHEASHTVFSEDLGCEPCFIDLGPQWGVGHGGCLDESAWYSVMAAGGAATLLCGEDTAQVDPRVGAYESAGALEELTDWGVGEGDLGNLLGLLREVEQGTSADSEPYVAPSAQEARDRLQGEIERIARILKEDRRLRERVDHLASHLYAQHCAGIQRIERNDFKDILSAGGSPNEQHDGATEVSKSGDPT